MSNDRILTARCFPQAYCRNCAGRLRNERHYLLSLTPAVVRVVRRSGKAKAQFSIMLPVARVSCFFCCFFAFRVRRLPWVGLVSSMADYLGAYFSLDQVR